MFKLSTTAAWLRALRAEGDLNRLGVTLGAGAFEITPRMFLFERVAAAMPKTLFDMGVFMANARP
jgi:hypothetical protein